MASNDSSPKPDGNQTMDVQDFLDRISDLVGGQVIYRRGPDFFGGEIASVEIVPHPTGKYLRLTTAWQAVERVNGWHPREDTEILIVIDDILRVFLYKSENILVNVRGKSMTGQFKFSLPGKTPLIKKVRGRRKGLK